MDQTTETKPAVTSQEPNEVQQAQAIQEQQLKDYIGEKPSKTEPKAETPVETTSKEEEKPAETTLTKPEAASTPPFDAQKLEESISQRVTDNIIKAFSGKSEQQMVEESPWAKEKRNPKSYEEIAAWVAHLTQQQLNAQKQTELVAQQEAQKQQELQLQQQKEQEAQIEKDTNTAWDAQWKDLETKDAALKSKDARKNFWQQIFDFNTERSKTGSPMVVNLAEFYALHYKPYVAQAAGSDAPISGANAGTRTSVQGDDYNYKTIHGARNLIDLLPKR